jgi:hypothetical protein
MENKLIKLLLIAILVCLVLLLIPVWGMFLSGMRGVSEASEPKKTVIESSSPSVSESAVVSTAAEEPTEEPSAEPTETPARTAVVLGEPDADGWVQVSLPLFEEPVMVKATLKEPNIALITVKVSKGMKILNPAQCWHGKNGTNGFIFLKEEEYTPGDRIIRLDSSGEIEYLSESGKAAPGFVLGTFKSDGEVTIGTEGMRPQAVAQTEIDAWFNTALEMVLGE